MAAVAAAASGTDMEVQPRSDITHQGQLAKLGGFFGNSAQPRYMVIRHHLCAYYYNEKDAKATNPPTKPRGTLDLRAVDVISHDDTTRYKGENGADNNHLRFTVRGPLLKKQYVLEATSKAERDKWVDAILTCHIEPRSAFGSFAVFDGATNSAADFFADIEKVTKVNTMVQTLQQQQNQQLPPAARVEAVFKVAGGTAEGLRLIDPQGDSILHHAVAQSSCDIALVRAFVDKGAMLQARNFTGRTVLHAAVDAGREPAFVAGLMDMGVSPLTCDGNGMSVFHLFMKKKTGTMEDFCDMLETLNCVAKQAAEERAAATGKPLEKIGDFINAVAIDRLKPATPLLLAAQNRHLDDDALRKIVHAGGNFLWRQSDTDSDPAVMRQRINSVGHLPSAATASEDDASILSERYNSEYLLELVIKADHLPDSRWFRLATGAEDDDSVMRLLDRVVNVMKEHYGDALAAEKLKTLAACCDYETLAAAMRRKSRGGSGGSSSPTGSSGDAGSSNMTLFNKLMELGANPKVLQASSGKTLLFEAAHDAKPELIDRLVELGVDINVGIVSRFQRERLRSRPPPSSAPPHQAPSAAADAEAAGHSSIAGAADIDDEEGRKKAAEQQEAAKKKANTEPEPLLNYAIDELFHSTEFLGMNKSAMSMWGVLKHLLQVGSPCTVATLKSAISFRKHDVYAFETLAGKVMEFEKVQTLAELDPDLILTLVTNGGVDCPSNKYAACDTICDVCAILCERGMKLDAVDASGDSALHGMLVRNMRLKPVNIAKMFEIILSSKPADGRDPAELLFARNKKNQTVLDAIGANEARLGRVLEAINRAVSTDRLVSAETASNEKVRATAEKFALQLKTISQKVIKVEPVTVASKFSEVKELLEKSEDCGVNKAFIRLSVDGQNCEDHETLAKRNVDKNSVVLLMIKKSELAQN